MKRHQAQNDSSEKTSHESRGEASSSVRSDATTDEQSVDLSQAAGQNEQSSNDDRGRNTTIRHLFPCLRPANPRMCTTACRLQTFLNHASVWLANRIRATPQQIVGAGFYFLGERDRVKCWYCNGGLQNWLSDHVPWKEHAKWFPLCEYVLQHKGPEYVHEVVRRFPLLSRPLLPHPASTASLPEALCELLQSPASTPSSSPTPWPDFVDPHETVEKIAAKVENDLINSIFVGEARMMGFSEHNIQAALQKYHTLHDDSHPDFASFVDDLTELYDAEEPEEQSAASSEEDAEQSELRTLEEQRHCKVCFTEFTSVVFLPCGHLCCCVGCSEEIHRCPVCKGFIKEKFQKHSRTEGRTF